MIVVLHPEQVRQVLELAADLGLDPETVAVEMFGPSPRSRQTRVA